MPETMKKMMNRRSIRRYTEQPVPREVLERIVEAGTYAATGMNRQSPIIVAVTDKTIRNQLSQMNANIMGADMDPFYGAPVVLVVLADKNMPTYIYDGSLVMGNLMLAAYDEGLGSCWIHRAKEEFDSPEGKALLAQWGIEGDFEGIGHCIIGYPAETPNVKPRKDHYVYWVE